MKSKYKREAWLLDDGVLIAGYTDKRGFHPNDTSCGFTTQKYRKRDIGKTVFYKCHATPFVYVATQEVDTIDYDPIKLLCKEYGETAVMDVLGKHTQQNKNEPAPLLYGSPHTVHEEQKPPFTGTMLLDAENSEARAAKRKQWEEQRHKEMSAAMESFKQTLKEMHDEKGT